MHRKSENIKIPHTKPNPAFSSTPVRTAHLCAYNCVQLWHIIQHWTVLIIFPHILQTIITAQMTSIGEDQAAAMCIEIAQKRTCESILESQSIKKSNL